MKKALPLLLAILLFVGTLARANRHFLKLNDGFSVYRIFSPLEDGANALPPSPIWNQKFIYLDRGHQSYVFESEDRQYVLKLYRFSSHDTLYNKNKLKETMASYQLAFDQLKEESGLIQVHLHPTHSQQTVSLVDRLGVEYTVPLNALTFVLQKKAKPFFPKLSELAEKNDRDGMQEALRAVFGLIVTRSKKGIIDNDAMLDKNYGWLENNPIHIDVGRFALFPQAKDPAYYQKEVLAITHNIRTWLRNEYPDFLPIYEEEINRIMSSSSACSKDL